MWWVIQFLDISTHHVMPSFRTQILDKKVLHLKERDILNLDF